MRIKLLPLIAFGGDVRLLRLSSVYGETQKLRWNNNNAAAETPDDFYHIFSLLQRQHRLDVCLCDSPASRLLTSVLSLTYQCCLNNYKSMCPGSPCNAGTELGLARTALPHVFVRQNKEEPLSFLLSS